jgi:predicted DNA-binding transcriptional regulator YafY
MADAEHWAVCLHYIDRNNRVTKRYVSPIRFVADDRFLALCLCREEPRQFYLNRCKSIELVPAAELMMPMAIA